MALQTKVMEYAGPRSYTLRLTLVEESTDITTNRSLISYKLEIISGGWAYSQFGTGWTVTLNGTQVSYKDRYSDPRINTGVAANGSCTVTSGQTYIEHGSDGTKTIAASASVDLAGSPGPGPMSIASQNWTLTAIPRESQLTVANGTLGTSQNITITPYVATYKHTLAYTCGTASGTIGTGLTGATSGFTKAWTPPLTLATQNTSGTSVSVTVTLTTFAADGTTQIGVTSATVNMAMPESIKPSVAVATSNPEGHLATYGGYIQNKSTCKITLTTTISQGAAISAYSIKVGTKLSYTSNGVTTNVLPEAGDAIPVVVTVTDTRGRTGTATVNIKVLAYSPPAISGISMIRTNSSGTALPTGAYATITFTASVTALGNHNTATYKAKYKTSAAASYSTSTLSTYANNYSVSNGKFTFSAAVASSYMAYIEVTDAFGAVDSVVVRVQSSAAFFKADTDNNAFTFGKLETKANTFMVAWDTEIDGNLKVGTIADVEQAIIDLQGGPEPITVDSALSSTSTNPVQNKVIYAALPTKTSQLANDSNFVVDNNYTHITVDSALSSTSTNPLQNKAINTALGTKLNLSGGTMTGKLTLKGAQTSDSYSGGALEVNNSNIDGVNGIFFNDASDSVGEGINFYRSATAVDTLRALNGILQFIPDRTLNTAGTAYEVPYITRYGRGTSHFSIVPYVEESTANRLAFLPADQIIIEQTTDGGTTWTSYGATDSAKLALFSGGTNVSIPRINDAKSTLCSVRVTFTAMKYNVPEGTAETEKYNYWNSNYIKSTERYTTLKELWFWVSAISDTIHVKAERATGAAPDNWSVIFNEDWGMTGWSGSDWIRFGSSTFGGGTTQTGNHWNYRLTFTSRYADGQTAFKSNTTQIIHRIKGYGESVWTAPNNFMKENHLYTIGNTKTATFPSTVTAPSFVGDLTGNATSATKATQDADGNAIKTTYAKLASPALTGTPTAPTAAAGTNTTQIATTAFVTSAVKVTGVKGNGESSYRTGNVNITAANIGLGNVNNTSDVNKPISTATQTALDGKAPMDRGFEFIRGTWTAASGTWTGTSEDSELYDGKKIILYMPFAGSGNATLNLTLSSGDTTGAKNVYFRSTSRFTTHLGQYSQVPLIYHSALNINGTNYEGWWYLESRDTDAYAYYIYKNYGTYKPATALYRYQILLTVDEDTLLPVNAVNNSTATTKTLTTESFNPFGPIYYYNSTTNITTITNTIAASALYEQMLADLRFSFNEGTTLTANKAIYLVCVPQNDGLVKLHTEPLSQDLPTSEDGLLYIYLGQTHDNYRVALYPYHPVYYYENGAIRLWTNPTQSSLSLATVANTGEYGDLLNKPKVANIFVQTATPTAQNIGDLWIELGE